VTNRATWGGVAIAAIAGTAAALAVRKARGRLGDRMTDRLFRRPGGRVARLFYRDAKPHQDAFRQTLAALALSSEDHLLEVGSGGGTFLAWALATGCTAKAIDHSTEMLALAARRNAAEIAAGRLELQQADAASLPFPDGEFTAAATINAFFFFDAPEAMLAEVYRTLAPTGRIAIHTAATAPPLIGRRMRIYTDDDLVTMLNDAGYEHIGLRRTGPGSRDQLVIARKPAGHPSGTTGGQRVPARTDDGAGSRV
jgi:SAM-dependent methyltransferase